MAFDISARATTPLQAARLEIGWKQTQTIYALRQAAEREGLSIATDRSLKTMLSRWENGHDRPDAVSQRLLCRVYGRTAAELGFTSGSLATPTPPRVAPAIGPEMVRYFRSVFSEHLRADNLMGPHHLVDVVRAQAALLDQILPSARGNVRGDLLTLAFRYSEFAGWLYQDACEPDKAMQFTDRAMEYTLESEPPRSPHMCSCERPTLRPI
jgi:transcriptional regulator with XRE-family HTH domain